MVRRSLFFLLHSAISNNQATQVDAEAPMAKSLSVSSTIASPLEKGIKRINTQITIISIYLLKYVVIINIHYQICLNLDLK